MSEDTIAPRSPGQLVKAADDGNAYYSCERFEDTYGRLAVGIGAKLEGKALDHVRGTDAKTVYVSRTPMEDGIHFRSAMRQVLRRARSGKAKEPRLPVIYDETWHKALEPTRRSVSDMVEAVHEISPEATELIRTLQPQPGDLVHALRVASYVYSLLDTLDCLKRAGLVSIRYPFSDRVRQEIFLAAVLHDIGRWRGNLDENHAENGACILRETTGRSSTLNALAVIVARHHTGLSQLEGPLWEAYKSLPLLLAEAMVESPETSADTVLQLLSEEAPDKLDPILLALCNLESVEPPRTVVRIGDGDDAQLAVSLQPSDDDTHGPYLLPFARWRAGRPHPTLFVHASDTDAVHSMMAPGHASWRKRPRRVISLLPDSVYRSKFGRYESLLPAFRRTLQRWVARPSGTRPRRSPSAVADGTKRSESSSGEGRDPSGPEEQAPLTSTTETNTPPGDQDAN